MYFAQNGGLQVVSAHNGYEILGSPAVMLHGLFLRPPLHFEIQHLVEVNALV